MFDGAELNRFVEQASWVALNDYEARMLCERTGRSLEALSRSHLRGVIVTLGAQGCDVWSKAERNHVPGVAAREVLDPTGCGDAFRAALLYGLERDWPLERCAALGNRIGAIKIAQPRRPESCAGSHGTRTRLDLSQVSAPAAEEQSDHGYPSLAHLRTRRRCSSAARPGWTAAVVWPQAGRRSITSAEEREGPRCSRASRRCRRASRLEALQKDLAAQQRRDGEGASRRQQRTATSRKRLKAVADR